MRLFCRLHRDYSKAVSRAEKIKVIERGATLYWPYYAIFLSRREDWTPARELDQIRAYGNLYGGSLRVLDYREVIPA